MGKEIKKVALFSPLLNKYQLSYLIEKGQVNIKVYKFIKDAGLCIAASQR